MDETINQEDLVQDDPKQEKNEVINQKLNQIKSEKTKNCELFKNNKELILIASMLVTGAIFGLLGGIIGQNLSENIFGASDTVQQVSSSTNTDSDDVYRGQSDEGTKSLSITSLAQRNAKSVVSIVSDTSKSSKQYTAGGVGSGLIISPDGYIITSIYTISNAQKLTVILGEEVLEASVIGKDEEIGFALLKIDKSDLQPVIFGDSSGAKIGEDVVVIGQSSGNCQCNVSKGIVSALECEVNINGKKMSLLKTDASINAGDTGAGLFNLRGELIGMVISNTKSVSNLGMGLILPIDSIKKPLNDIKGFGYVRGRASIEMNVSDASMLKPASIYKNCSKGAFITSVPSGSNAQASGFEVGDCIISINSQEIENTAFLEEALKHYSSGDTISVGVVRKNENLNLNLQLAERK